MNSRKFVVAVLIAQGAILAAASAKADVVYTYTGNDFTSTFAPGYTTSDKITGTLTLSSALPDSVSVLTNEVGLVVSYSFSDGVTTLTKPCCDTGSQTAFDFTTDASGNIASWQVTLETDVADVNEIETDGTGGTSFDQALVSGTLGGSNTDDPGVWSLQSSVTTSVPEPGSLSMLASALLALGLLLRSRTRKAG